jgi:hypothetical protein
MISRPTYSSDTTEAPEGKPVNTSLCSDTVFTPPTLFSPPYELYDLHDYFPISLSLLHSSVSLGLTLTLNQPNSL